MDKYGTDSLRFTIVYLAPLGNDVLFDEEKTQIGRNFITKLWNAGRFLLMMKEKVKTDGTEQSDKYVNDLTDKWLESRYNSSLKNADRFLHEYRIDEYTKTLYNFVWSDYCDWYIELMKIKINEYPEQSGRIISDAIDYYENILKILHPVIPYVTEELWHNLKEGRAEKSISIEMLPDINESKIDPDQEIKFEKVKEIASAIRNLKAVNNIPASFRSEVFIISSGDSKKLISEYRMY
ncbi:MAG: class I tRNA ligase family protein, partial [Ignavibacteria bacterium]